ncbi:MAG: SDR family NAD(P)-dependent oxidoreductase [Sphingomonadaceae bacterium]|nr:SDR family NAD(P)-dependent oxidoreductase [Sphingomonadaceae bacterium]
MALDGKVLVVTGGGRGIGRETALYCASKGASIVVVDPGVGTDGSGQNSAPAEQTAQDIMAAGGKAHANFASVTDTAGANSMVEDALTQFGRIDGVINAAGFLRDGWWHKMSRQQWDEIIDAHLNGAYNVCKAATPHFREQESGSFVLFTSPSAVYGNRGQSNYSAAKHGVIGLTQSIAIDMGHFKVRANCIAPTAWTRLIEQTVGITGAGDDVVNKMKTDLGADKIAPLAAYLVSDAAQEISGYVLEARGDKVSFFDLPRPVATLEHEGGWTIEALADELGPAIHSHGGIGLGHQP